jgi:glycosyltransferase involved in cell wall biosynthesis
VTDLDLSVVVPVLNEEENVDLVYREISQVLQRERVSYQLIFVDDGSTDATCNKLRRITLNDPRVETIRFPRNFGQSSALQAGFDRALGKVVVTMDGDLQNDPHDIPHLMRWINQGYDVVCGWRRSRQDRWFTRRLPSQVANWLIGRLSGVRVHDNGCTLKAYRNELVKRTVLLPEMHRFLAPLLSLSGGRWKEIAVNHRPRRFGRTKYGLGRIWKVALDMLALKMILRFVSHPSAWFGLLCTPFVVTGALTFGVGLLQWMTSATPNKIPIVLPAVALLCSFCAVYLVLLGLLAELVVHYGDFSETEPLVVQVERKRSSDG